MKNTLLFRFAATLALALLLGRNPLKAQNTSDGANRLVLRVDGLTSATRDAVARDLNSGGQAHLVFACVPAGILVLEPSHTASRQQVRDLALSTIHQRAGATLITELAFSAEQAEAECAQVRDR